MEQIFYYTGAVVCILLILGVGVLLGFILYIIYLDIIDSTYWVLHRQVNKIYKKLSDEQKKEITKELKTLLLKYRELCKN